METNIGIADASRLAVSIELNKILADETVLYLKTRNAHWNVEGADFHEKHVFLESQYHKLEAIIDNVAERVRFIGHYASATLKSMLQLTSLTEERGEKNDSNGFMTELLADHEAIIIHLRERIIVIGEKYTDFGTTDFLTGLMETHEKMAWILRAHL